MTSILLRRRRTVEICVFGGDNIELGPRGEQITDNNFLRLINASAESTHFTLPGSTGGRWVVRLDTATGLVHLDPGSDALKAGDSIGLVDRSVVLLELTAPTN